MKDELTPRERVTLALNHQEPDRVPIDISYTWEPYVALRHALGLPEEGVRPDVWSRVTEQLDLVKALGTDFVRAGLGRASRTRPLDFFHDNEYSDEFGISFRKVQRPDGGIQYEMHDYPLKEPTMDALEAYEWPDPLDGARYQGVEERVRYLYEKTDYAILMRLGGNVFEKASYLRGQANWYMDLALYPDFAVALMQRLAALETAIYLKGLDVAGQYISIIRLGGEDLGTQQGLLISPKTFRTLVKPILSEMYRQVKEKFLNLNPEGKLMLHTCGGVRLLIPDFIEMGIDILDPLQPQAKGMNGFALKRDFGDRLSFHGGLNTQGVLPFGTEEEVECEVQQKLEMLAPGGGYILNPSHNVLGDIPPKNLIRMVEAGKRLGRYPIRRTIPDEELMVL